MWLGSCEDISVVALMAVYSVGLGENQQLWEAGELHLLEMAEISLDDGVKK